MHGDIFATKGAEYLIVIAYLVLLVLAARYLAPAPVLQTAGTRRARRGLGLSWFSLGKGLRFHQGHSWASESDGDVVTVGLDDFAAQLIGTPDAMALPDVGASVRQGGPGWQLRAGDRTLKMVSPVEGKVVAVNQAVLDAPQRAADDPYGEGWLLKVRTTDRPATLRNLLSGELAAAWMQQTVERLRRLPADGLGELMPDGGTPVRGFGRALGAEEWAAVSRDFFLSE
jgi:glycine cleavage system H protein